MAIFVWVLCAPFRLLGIILPFDPAYFYLWLQRSREDAALREQAAHQATEETTTKFTALLEQEKTRYRLDSFQVYTTLPEAKASHSPITVKAQDWEVVPVETGSEERSAPATAYRFYVTLATGEKLRVAEFPTQHVFAITSDFGRVKIPAEFPET